MPEYSPFTQLLTKVRSQRIDRWSEVLISYLDATSGFDTEFASGAHDKGWYQQKAKFFNDIVVALLENRSGKAMSTRQKKRSALFSELDIDVCFDNANGEPVIGAEVKQLGTPPHPGNSGPRPASQDLHKRAREVAFTSVDFKLAYASPTPIKSFQNWIDRTPPGYFTFWSMRVAHDKDLSKVRSTLVNLRTYCNGVGAVIYRERGSPTDYEPVDVSELDIDRLLREIAQRVS